MMPHIQLPLNLPHAGVIAQRIVLVLQRDPRGLAPEAMPAHELAGEIFQLLAPFSDEGENPPDEQAAETQRNAAELARRLVEAIQSGDLKGERMGQCVRNLFECLSLGEEGARLSLLAGEDPKSLQRPY